MEINWSLVRRERPQRKGDFKQCHDTKEHFNTYCQSGTSKHFTYIALINPQNNPFSFTVTIPFSCVGELRQRGTKFPQGHTHTHTVNKWGSEVNTDRLAPESELLPTPLYHF